MSVTEPSDAVKRRNRLTDRHRLALGASLRPQLALWLVLAHRDYDIFFKNMFSIIVNIYHTAD